MPYCPICSAEYQPGESVCGKCRSNLPPNPSSPLGGPKTFQRTILRPAGRYRRLTAAAIDFAICATLLGYVIRYFIGGWARILARPSRNTVIAVFAVMIAATCYAILRDTWGGKSVGKILLGLTTVNAGTGRRSGLKDSLLRNSVFGFIAIPIIGWAIYAIVSAVAAFQILAGANGRIGDGLADTAVVADEDFT